MIIIAEETSGRRNIVTCDRRPSDHHQNTERFWPKV